ncbi:hypothetical protein BKA66DRAFT_513595 [Pyrenochaeta sp. MPI-SDFR-AT-0127]|nr:hypothetical protein BKA66DRAFT_513595 [Pyrenochaeta sp. MPI-SDFR-AT-0127]
MSWLANVVAIIRQSFFLPKPPLTEQNLPDQTGKVHIVTGGYSGCGRELTRILYGKNATVYVAGRSHDKAAKAIESIKRDVGKSKGRLEFLKLDLADQNTIKASTEEFLSKEQRLDVLTNNAGIMLTKEGSKDVQDHEIHLGTNCLGPFLFSTLLLPILCKTALSSPPGSVRVTWASSLAAVFLTPTHGMEFETDGSPRVSKAHTNYGVSKAGNWFLAAEFARRYGKEGVLSVAWNPGNLRTELQRDIGAFRRRIVELLLFPAVYGAYTEIYAGWSTDLALESNGAYVYPWGRNGTSTLRADLLAAAKPRSEGGTGEAKDFWAWCDKETAQFR